MLTIRPATIDDAPSIYRVHTAAIRQICSGSYAPEEIADWSGALAAERYVDAMGQCDFEVAELDGTLAAFSVLDIPHAELHALYVAPEHGRRGIGRALLARAEANAAARGISDLHLKATLNAVTFYEANGWIAVGPSTHPLPSGRILACVLMTKLVTAPHTEESCAAASQGTTK
ncbi:MAG TPA: GNAT family N-acetyltransferase [Thermoanaerobaculia bacterium]